MLADINLAPLDLATVESFVGNGIPKFVERCLAAYDLPFSDVSLSAMRTYYDADQTTLTVPYPHVIDCLTALKTTGVKMAICTNKPLAPAQSILNGLGLAAFFEVVIGGDTYAHNKPHAQPLLGCASQMGANIADCIFVGDSETDEATAVNAKMTFALFSGGYRKTATNDMQHDFLFDDFAALADYASG
ncbi:MAG: HAD-IA family hydrolase [Rhodobacteraceae bacterium]|nr:HAD-IA family hydrolase [Paracoccaceae bacterium]